ncbi:PAS domain S-box protein [Ktedonobacter racemifer]|nr:PAS domain S-box protein [Ktedonobacter racemifer]
MGIQPLNSNHRFRPSVQLASLLDTLPDALFFLDIGATIQYANAKASALMGISSQDLPGHLFWQSAPHLVTTALYQAVGEAMRTQQSQEVHYRSPITRRWLRGQLFPTSEGLAILIHSLEQEPTCFPASVCHSDQHYRDFLEHSAERVAILTPEGLILEINQRLLTDAQVQREEVIGKPLTAFPLWASVPRAQGQLGAAIEQASRGETVRFETYICPHPGRCLDLAVALAPRYAANQQVEYLICTGFDITRYKRVEEELRTLVDAVPQFVWIRRPDGSIAYSNRRSHDYARMMSEQRPEDEWFPQLAPNDRQCIQGMWRTAPRTDITYDEATSLQFVHPEDRERVLALQRQGWEAGEPYEFEYRLRERQPGAYRWFLSRGVPLRNEEGQIIQWVGTCTDIDEQKRTEDALRQSQERVNHLMNSSVIGIFFAEGDKVVEANNTFLRMTGYSWDVLSQRRLTWDSLILPTLKSSLAQQAHQELVVQQYTTPFETELVCKDGSRLDVLMGGVAFHGETLQGIGFVLDNSARKELERRKDTFISMANHELRTPLTAIKIQTQLLKKRLVRQGLHEAAAALSRVEEPLTLLEWLVGDLLDVTRIQAGRLEYHWEPVDLDALLQDVTNTMQQMDPTHIIAVRGTISRLLLGDKGRLAQVFLNLISNAIKYAPDALLIDIEASASAETATVAVRDHGIGIPQEQCEKIFERFYRVNVDLPHDITWRGKIVGVAHHKVHNKGAYNENHISVCRTYCTLLFAFQSGLRSSLDRSASFHRSYTGHKVASPGVSFSRV